MRQRLRLVGRLGLYLAVIFLFQRAWARGPQTKLTAISKAKYFSGKYQAGHGHQDDMSGQQVGARKQSGSQRISSKNTVIGDPIITTNPSALTILNTSVLPGNFPQSYTVSASNLTDNLTISVPPPYYISAVNSGQPGGPSITLSAVNGVVPPTTLSVALVIGSSGVYDTFITHQSGTATLTMPLNGTVVSPSLSVSPAVLPSFSTTVGTPSAPQTYTVTALNELGGQITAPEGFEIRMGNEPYAPFISIPDSVTPLTIPVDVRLTGAVSGVVSGSIAHRLFIRGNPWYEYVSVSGTVSETLPTLSVSHRDADYGNKMDQIIRPYLQINNEGNIPIPYNQLTLRYWFTSEGNSPPTDLPVFYAQLGTKRVKTKYVALSQPRQGAFGYVDYEFDASAGNLAPHSNSGPIENGILKTDRSPFNEGDDYSYSASPQFTKNPRITAYWKGSLVWGQEPAEIPLQSSVKAYSSAKSSPVTTSISTVVELKNDGNVPILAQDLTVRYWFTTETNELVTVHVDYAQIGAHNIESRIVRLSEPLTGANAYVELRPTVSSMMSPLSSLGPIEFRIVKFDYTLLDQRNDYSYRPVAPLAENPKITVYQYDYLIYGTEPTNAGSRKRAENEGEPTLSAVLLQNPVLNETAVVEVRGAAGQPICFQLVDGQGRALSEQRIEQTSNVVQHTVSLARKSTGLYLLRVNTPTQGQVLKVVKPE